MQLIRQAYPESALNGTAHVTRTTYTGLNVMMKGENIQLRIEATDVPRRCPCGGSGGGGVGLDKRLNGSRRPMAAAVDDDALRMPFFRGGSRK